MKDKNEAEKSALSHNHEIIGDETDLQAFNNNHQALRWYTEPLAFDSYHEAYEWVISGPLCEIGYLFDGYITSDEKLAQTLLFELIRLKTITENPKSTNDPEEYWFQNIYADYEYTKTGILHKVWVDPPHK